MAMFLPTGQPLLHEITTTILPRGVPAEVIALHQEAADLHTVVHQEAIVLPVGAVDHLTAPREAAADHPIAARQEAAAAEDHPIAAEVHLPAAVLQAAAASHQGVEGQDKGNLK
jgi:hypothetical protein